MNGGSGHCLCGAVRYSFEGAPNWQAHCHCESCRRNCSAPFTSYFAVSHGKWHWTGARPRLYRSSPGARRLFCATCGTPMAFEGDRWPGEIHFYAASLADPAAYAPTVHVNWNEHLPWVVLADGLTRHRAPRRLGPDEDCAPVLGLLSRAFADMAGRIDPPSSVTRLTEAGIARQARDGEVWLLEEGGAPIACLFLTPRPDCLYLGKLAVDAQFRRQGLARQLVRHAQRRARDLGLPALTLETRVELTENHTAFRSLGFEITGESCHPGHDRPTSLTFTRHLG